MDDYLFEAMQLVKEVDGVLKSIQDNVAKTRAILGQWQKDLMFDRKEGRVRRGGWAESRMRRYAALC